MRVSIRCHRQQLVSIVYEPGINYKSAMCNLYNLQYCAGVHPFNMQSLCTSVEGLRDGLFTTCYFSTSSLRRLH